MPTSAGRASANSRCPLAHAAPLADIWEGPGLEHIRETTAEIKGRIDALGEAGMRMNFCPGAAHTHSGDPMAVYPAAERRLVSAGGDKVRLRLVS